LKASLAFLLVLLSAQSFASTGRAYGLLNTSLSYLDNGKGDGDGGRNMVDMASEGYGVGGEYKFNLPNEVISFRGGFIYEFQRNMEQVTQVASGAADTTREDMPTIQMTTLYVNGHLTVSENISLVGGVGYYIPKVTGRGIFSSYKISSGLGYQFGVDFKLPDNFFVQILKRRIVLDSKDESYKGKADLSNLSLLVGKEF